MGFLGMGGVILYRSLFLSLSCIFFFVEKVSEKNFYGKWKDGRWIKGNIYLNNWEMEYMECGKGGIFKKIKII